jgi:hypothetical protein
VTGSRSIPRASACATIARASGCSDSLYRRSHGEQLGLVDVGGDQVGTSGSPLVSVPVLSITTVVIRAEVSRAVAFLNSTPRRAPSDPWSLGFWHLVRVSGSRRW